MKEVLFIFSLIMASLFSNAQTGTGTLIATSKVNGGGNIGNIVSTTWAVQGTPPAPVTFANPKAATTAFTVTAPGVYSFVATVKDNHGNVATGTFVATAYLQQSIGIDASKSTLKVTIFRKQYVKLDGTASKILNGDGTGFFKKWQWRQIDGKTFRIGNANSIMANTIVKSSGKYAWELTGIDNLNNIGKDTFNITIK